MSQLRPASALAQQYGVKALAFGGPGSGKTPLVATAPRVVLCATEPGLLSLRGSNVPTWEAHTTARFEEFMTWATTSQEANNFDTIAIDSISQAAEMYLAEAVVKHKHGLKAYGDMAERIGKHVNALYFMQRKHVYLIAKQSNFQEGGGLVVKRPYFPGNELNIKVPHLYDEILHVGLTQVPGVAGQVRAIRTAPTLEVAARDRSGKLAELEPCDLGALFSKCMS